MKKLLAHLRNSEMLNSKKFRAFVVGLVILLLDSYGITEVDPETIEKVVVLVLGYMGFQGGVDMVKAFHEPRTK